MFPVQRIESEGARGLAVRISPLHSLEYGEILNRFAKFCQIDLRLRDRTIKRNVSYIRKLLQYLENKGTDTVSQDDLREYLSRFDSYPHTYSNVLKSLKRYFRDFLKQPDLVGSFRFPSILTPPITVPSKEELNSFYEKLSKPIEKALFLMYATSGRRKNELLSLRMEDIDLEKCMIKPRTQENGSKHQWFSFFNQEAKAALLTYLSNRKDDSRKLFRLSHSYFNQIWSNTSMDSGVKISPQILRQWFACEMGRLNVPDRYLDAFCGRTPKSVLARRYSDYSPERLKEIYDKAELKILN